MFGDRMFFLNFAWRFLIWNDFFKLEFKLEEIIRIRNMQEKLEKMRIATSDEN